MCYGYGYEKKSSVISFVFLISSFHIDIKLKYDGAIH